ncbi:MAG: discoidin domain-containing protein [Thomasclavelia sp.]|uniref:discoidin domain-containing protein n=1 Tax=Thomasclavelia sp. TaxID=3025757 RepID=UPI0039A35D99
MNNYFKKICAGQLVLTMALSNVVMPTMAATPENPNFALNASADGTNTEGYGNTYDKAIDGDYSTRLASLQNTKPTLVLDLGQEKEISFMRLFLEQRKDGFVNNVKRYKVIFATDENFTEGKASVERTLDSNTCRDDVLLSKTIVARYVKLEVLETHGDSSWDNAAICEFELYEKPFNLSLGATATGQNTEGYGNTYDKAIDGDYTTKLSSSRNTKPILDIDLGEQKDIKYIRMFAEDRKDAPKNNIQEFKITVSQDEIFDENDPSITKTMDNETILSTHLFDETVSGRYVRVEVTKTHNSQVWDNGAISEFELYDYPFSEVTPETGITIDDVRPSYDLEANKIVVPKVAGYTIENNGADFEQIVDKDFNVYRPLLDKEVKISLKIKNNITGEEKITSDYSVIIPGVYESNNGNEKPIVSPELAEWYSDSSENFVVTQSSRIVIDPVYKSELEYMAKEFQNDYKDITGREIDITYSDSASAGDFYFTLNSEDDFMGDEGYFIDIKDQVKVSATNKLGAYWSTRTILQILTQNENKNILPYGKTRDYPKYKVRGFVLDVARKPFSMDVLKDIAKNMAWHKMNDFQVHLSDNYIWLEDYGVHETENEAFKAYDAFRLESNVKNAEGESATAKDYAYSKAEFKQFIEDSRKFGVNIVPEIDIPAHANSFTKVFPEIMVKNQTSSTAARRPLVDHIDISKPEAIEKVKEIFDEYTTGEDATFDSQTTVHIGADEFLADYTAYRNFINDFVPHVKQTNPVRMWGGLTWIKDNPETQINKEAIENVEMNLWSRDWADGIEMYDMGYKVINTIDTYMYMVPNGSGGQGSYNDYLNTNNLFNNFEPNIVSTKSGWKSIPSGDDQTLGAAFAIWNDNIDKRASGLSEADMYKRFQDALPVIAEKTWANGKEKESLANVKAASDQVGLAPNSNPLFEETEVDGVYANYTFEENNELNDVSKNDRDLSDATNVVYSKGKKSNAVKLEGGESYIETPLNKLGDGNELSFDLKLEEAQSGQILFESDSAYGSHDIRITENGKLGFTRELYNYEFNYELPLNKWTNITIRTSNLKTALYVDGEFVAYATGQFVHNDMVKKSGITNSTFALSIDRIGSKTNAIKGKIDNVKIARSDEEKGKIDNNIISASASTENTADGEVIANTLDNNPNTIWHSNWHDSSVTLPVEVTFTFDTPTEIAKLNYLPRQNGTNGNITKFDLYVTDENNIESKIVENYTWSGDNALKTVKFDSKTAKSVRMVITGSHGDTINKFASAAEFSFFAPVDEDNNEIDKTILMNMVTTVNQLDENDYTTSSFDQKVIDDLLLKADEVINNKDAGEDDLFEICNRIQEFLDSLVERGNVDALDALVKDYSSLVENEYTVDSWSAYKQVLNNAIAIIADNSNSSQADIDKVKDQLINAREQLVRKEETTTNKTALSIAIDMAKDVTQEQLGKLVPAVADEFKAALENAETIYAKDNASQEEVNNAFDRLAKVMQMLEFYKGDKIALQEMMDKIANLTASDYTESTWSALQLVLTEVNKVLADENAMQPEVDDVYTELVKAFVNLRLKPNKNLLEDLINKANGYNKVNYTAASWALFEGELDNANKVLNDPEATEAQINDATNGLTKAMAGLVANPSNPPVDNNTNNPGTTVKPGDTTVNATKTGDTTNMMYPLAGLALASLVIYGNKKRKEI